MIILTDIIIIGKLAQLFIKFSAFNKVN